jgi:hypothetical protein
VTTPAPRATVALEAARITAAARATSRPTTSASSRTPARGIGRQLLQRRAATAGYGGTSTLPAATWRRK